jgi:hydroxymethylbilane synthase
MATEKIIFGTRGSALALWQTDHAMALLRAAHPGLQVERDIIQTRGDALLDTPLPLIGGKGVFTAELEAALRDGRLDCAVHSLKDLPTDPSDGLVIGAILPRANPADVLVSRAGYTLDTLPPGARVGTSSYRRGAQLLHKRPDLRVTDIRGNVDTRVRKALAAGGEYEAIVLAYAGLERLDHLDVVSQILSYDDMLPAPGQGAIAVQTRDEPVLLALLQPIHHRDTALAVTAERAFLTVLGGGCLVPVAAYAYRVGEQLHLRGRVSARDGSQQIEVAASARIEDETAAGALGARLAQQALDQGATALMEAEA